MQLGLGIDTGGTYTDVVVVELESKRVLAKAKAPTTYQDLSLGIAEALDGAIRKGGFDLGQIRLVGLSTTLATNSILQGKGGEVGLIGIGWEPQRDWVLGCKKTAFIKGGCDSLGKVLQTIDPDELREAINEVTKGTDAIVVSGMFSVCNPWQESEVADAVGKASSLPVVEGHELTGELGILERTVTAVLNARLLPIIDEFLISVQTALSSRGITARILVFKGDGGLMALETARKRPVETILSGPAASLIGGKVLSGLDDCIVVDVGGTSTDIAFLDEGFPRLNLEGAMVGEWRTRVRAIDMWTTGLGGDSLIQMDAHGDLKVGPERVVPLAIASTMRSDLKEAMATNQETTFYLAGKADAANLTEGQRAVHCYLSKNGPRSFFEIMDGVPEVILLKDALTVLMARGNVLRTGLTPTDVMHLHGEHVVGDVEASRLGLQILAMKMDRDPNRLANSIMERAVTRVGEEIVKKVIADEVGLLPSNLAVERMLHSAIGESMFNHITMKTGIDRPVIGIGAPARIMVKPLEQRMNVQVVIPENFDVGNAVGAVCSQISESVSMQVYPKENKYLVFSQFCSPLEFFHLEEAISSARTSAERYVRDKVETAQAEDVKVKVDVLEKRFSDGYGKESRFVNFVLVRATATGRPKLPK
jgi:N-methylhydantoinase A/oxoprolinase/acetone carboxylase beta subunit